MKVLKQFLFELNRASFGIRRRVKNRVLGPKRLFVQPEQQQDPDGKTLTHLGCDIASLEFINVDARPAPHVQYVRNVTDLSIFGDGYADLVYACHVLEHTHYAKS